MVTIVPHKRSTIAYESPRAKFDSRAQAYQQAAAVTAAEAASDDPDQDPERILARIREFLSSTNWQNASYWLDNRSKINNVLFSNLDIYGNFVTSSGGGIALLSKVAYATVVDVAIHNNFALLFGGGVFSGTRALSDQVRQQS